MLDPDNGSKYKCYVAVEDNGKRLKVRGFIGFSVLGRTQYWVRDKQLVVSTALDNPVG